MKKKKSIKRKVQVRFLKVNDNYFIYEEFDGKILKEICVDFFESKDKNDSKSINMLVSSEKGKRHSYEDGTHPVTYLDFCVFYNKVKKAVEYMAFSSHGYSLIKLPIKIVDSKKLIYQF